MGDELADEVAAVVGTRVWRLCALRIRGRCFSVVDEVVFVDLQVPDVSAVPAAVGHDVTRLPAELGRLDRHAMADAAAVDADDGVGDGHPSRLARGHTGSPTRATKAHTIGTPSVWVTAFPSRRVCVTLERVGARDDSFGGGSMRKVSVFLVVLSLAALSFSSSPAGAAPGTCEEPVGRYRYTGSEMAYELSIDLAGCTFWNGTSITLSGFLERQFPAGLHSGLLGVVGTETTGHQTCVDPIRVTRCSITIGFGHPPTELMVYSGKIGYPWENGTRSRQFKATCLTVGDHVECRDEP